MFLACIRHKSHIEKPKENFHRLKTTICEVTTLDGINNLFNVVKEKISSFEDRVIETLQNAMQGEKENLKYKQRINKL